MRSGSGGSSRNSTSKTRSTGSANSNNRSSSRRRSSMVVIVLVLVLVVVVVVVVVAAAAAVAVVSGIQKKGLHKNKRGSLEVRTGTTNRSGNKDGRGDGETTTTIIIPSVTIIQLLLASRRHSHGFPAEFRVLLYTDATKSRFRQ